MEYWLIPLAIVVLLVVVTRPWWASRLAGRPQGAELPDEVAKRRIESRLEDFRATVELPCDVATTVDLVEESLAGRDKWRSPKAATWEFGSFHPDDLVIVAEPTSDGSRLRVVRALEVEQQLQGVRNWVALASDVIDRAAGHGIEAHESTQAHLVRDEHPSPVEADGSVVTDNAYVWRATS